MPSNADVNVIPTKMTTSGDAAGYVKINDNNFEIVSQIPAADVESGSSTVGTFTATPDTVNVNTSGRWNFAFTIPTGVTVKNILRVTISVSEANQYIAFIPTNLTVYGTKIYAQGYAVTSYTATPSANVITATIVYA